MAHMDATYRASKAFSVVTTGTSATSDVSLTIPPGWDAFWDAIDDDGYGVRFTEADGVTPIDYQLLTWTPASRVAVYELDDAPMPAAADRCVLMWMYFAPTGTETDGSSSFTASSPVTAAMELGEPDVNSAIRVSEQVPGAAAPASRIAKSVAEVRDVFFALSPILQPASAQYNGRRLWEEPGVATVEVLDDTGTAVGSMNEPSAMRWVSVDQGGGRRSIYLRARVKAGTDATRYTLAGTVRTATPLSTPTYRTLPLRLGVQVRDQLET